MILTGEEYQLEAPINMDPRILQLLQARQGAQQSPDMENPQEQSVPGDNGEDQPFSLGDGQFEQNPFESILNSLKQSSQGGQEAPVAPQGGQMPNIMDPKANQLNSGSNPGMSKYLSTAVSQLQSFIAESTNRDEIMTARGIIALLSKLIQDEQVSKADELNNTPQPAPQGAPAPAGQPA